MSEPVKFKVGKKRAKAAIVMLGITILLNFLGISAGIFRLLYILKIEKGDLVDEDLVMKIDNIYRLLMIAHFPIALICGIPFIMWFYRAYKNLLALGIKNLEYALHWTIISFFIPILNFIYPYKVAKEIWNASDPVLGLESDKKWETLGEPKIVARWWTPFILSGAINNFGNLIFKWNNPEHTKYLTGLSLISDTMLIVAAVFAMIMIVELNKRQQAKYQSLLQYSNLSQNDVLS